MLQCQWLTWSDISRTLRYKAITAVGIGIGFLGYTFMAVRWRYGANVWESLYYAAAGFSVGMSLIAQFVGLTAAAPEDQKGAAVGVYYLSQQVGMIIGIGSFAATVESIFGKNLDDTLGNLPEKAEVSYFHFSNTFDALLDDQAIVLHAKAGHHYLDNQRRP